MVATPDESPTPEDEPCTERCAWCRYDVAEHPADHDGRGAVPAAVRDGRGRRVSPHPDARPGTHPRWWPRAAPALRRFGGVRAQPGDVVHRSVPLLARGRQDQWHRQAGDRSGDGLARPRRGADARRLVPGWRISDPLPRQVACQPRRSGDPGQPRKRDGLRRRRPPDRPRGGGVPQGGSVEPVRFLRVDRP